MKLLDFAEETARVYHSKQKRKYTGEPYFNHCKAVKELCNIVTDDEDVLSAAFLHDLMEDCELSQGVPFDVGWLMKNFNVRIATFVDFMTEPVIHANRASRKALQLERFDKMAPREVKLIKLADLIDNSESIIKHDERFAPVFMQEMSNLIEVLRPGSELLYSKAKQIVTDYNRSCRSAVKYRKIS